MVVLKMNLESLVFLSFSIEIRYIAYILQEKKHSKKEICAEHFEFKDESLFEIQKKILSLIFHNILNLSPQVFIHNGQIHIIPLPSNPSEISIFPTGKPSINQAFNLILGGQKTIASAEVQKSIFARTNK